MSTFPPTAGSPPAATTSDLYPAPVAYDSFTAVKRRRDGLSGTRTGSQRVPATA
jgi:hypothetical protein